MKLWKCLVLALAVCLVGGCLFSCGTTPPDTSDVGQDSTAPDEAEIESTGTEETQPETTEFVCTHPNMAETVLVEASCLTGGEIEKKCEDCGYMEKIVTGFAHEDESGDTAESGITEYTCRLCGDRSMIVAAGKRLRLSAVCEGRLSFSLASPTKEGKCDLLIDGEMVASAEFSEDGKAEIKVEGLKKGGHVVELVNGGACELRVKAGEIDGYFSRPDSILVEVLGRGGQKYSSFRVYVQTGDPSGDYYVCYNFDYKYSTKVNDYAGNSCTNTRNYRINGASLCRATLDFDKINKTTVMSVLGGGEVSFAVRQANPYLDQIAQGAKSAVTSEGVAADFIGGYHGDEWFSEVSLIADGEPVDLTATEPLAFACSTVVFEQLTTMYAWATATSADMHGLPVAEHFQNIVIDSTGITHRQTVQWLRGDFKIKYAYMPMFTMMRGKLSDRFIDTMRMYDAAGNLLEEYKMGPEEITTQTSVMKNSTATAIEYSGSRGVSARVDFRVKNDQAKLGTTYVALRVGLDNKLYVPITSASGSTPGLGEIWDVETKYMIDYIKP